MIVQGGGERTSYAAGQFTIKFFFDEDLENAPRLALAFAEAEPPADLHTEIDAQQLHPSEALDPTPGTLEIWISSQPRTAKTALSGTTHRRRQCR